MLDALAISALAALVSGVVLTGLCVVLGRRLNALDAAGSEGHAKSVIRRVPNIGGIAIVASIGIGVLAYFLPFSIGGDDGELQSGINERLPMGIALAVAVAVLHVMGLVDDRKPLGVPLKFAIMASVSAVFPVFFETRLFEFFDQFVGGSWASILMTVVWFVAVINAMNFMDNMDGLSATTAVVASVFFLIAAAASEQWFIAGVLVSLASSAAGFLFWNLPKAKIFMGDGGSLVIGFLLAFLTTRTTFYGLPHAGDHGGGAWFSVLMPVCVLAVPIYDLVAVSAVRLSQGRSPMVGDEQHFSHRLRARGLNEWQVLCVVAGCTAVTGLAGVMLTRLEGWWGALAGAQVFVVLASIAVFEFGSRRSKRTVEGAQ